VTSVGGTTYTYDNNGNVTAIGSLDYTWDWRNRLATAERSGGGVTSYGYDHTGQRVFQATGNATTSYPNRYYNVASSSLTATTTKHIFSPDGTLLATVVGSGTSTASTTYLHPDHLGGTNVATDENGDVVQTLDYYPYGSQRVASGSFSEQRRYIGEEYDSDTDFSYLNARYYQGSRGQFISQDPVSLLLGDPNGIKQMTQREMMSILADPQILNSYSYARNNPLVIIDKSGEIAFVPLILSGIKIYGAYSLGSHLGEALNAQFLFPELYTPSERNDAWFAFGYDALTEAAGLGLTDELGAFLTLSSDLLDGLDVLDEAGEAHLPGRNPRPGWLEPVPRINLWRSIRRSAKCIAKSLKCN
jgi:RHS repeat-associated protein